MQEELPLLDIGDHRVNRGQVIAHLVAAAAIALQCGLEQRSARRGITAHGVQHRLPQEQR